MNKDHTIYETTEYGTTYNASQLNVQKESTRVELLKRTAIARDYIIQNYNQKFSLKDVAQASCLSVNHLLRTFKAVYGVSPYQFLSIVKLEKAKFFLEESNYQIAYISFLIGFDSISSFIRLFKSVFNITPLKYKRLYITQRSC
ncbi:MAG TPA: AraC family transcriptional regulator [Pedobacter sp.]|nr:AraC family transcriptional regulator [Pedobacter sp.]